MSFDRDGDRTDGLMLKLCARAREAAEQEPDPALRAQRLARIETLERHHRAALAERGPRGEA